MATATTTHTREGSTTVTPEAEGDWGGGGGYGMEALVSAIRSRRAKPMRDNVNVGRTQTRGGRANYHSDPRPPAHFGGPTPEKRISRAQAKMAEVAARDAVYRQQAAERGPDREYRGNGVHFYGLQPKTETMNAYQRELYLPQESAIGPSPQRDYNDQLAATRGAQFDEQVRQDRMRAHFGIQGAEQQKAYELQMAQATRGR